MATRKNPFRKIKVDKRFVGHGCCVTCIQWSASELVSGDIKGTILVWDIPESQILSRCVGL